MGWGLLFFVSAKLLVVFCAMLSGMWTGEESSTNGVYNSWFSSISNFGVFGGMGH